MLSIPDTSRSTVRQGSGVQDIQGHEPAGAENDSCTESLPASELRQMSVEVSPPDCNGGDKLDLEAHDEAAESLELDDIDFDGSGPELMSRENGIEPLANEFLVRLADKVIESKKCTKGNVWTMKDVLATGHLSGVDVEFRKRIWDSQVRCLGFCFKTCPPTNSYPIFYVYMALKQLSGTFLCIHVMNFHTCTKSAM